ncbi:MAG: phosphatase PAP2 family protein [Candidatus Neomarinimicrobiota bacterium]
MSIIEFLQSFQSDGLTSFFKFFTFFGDKEFYIMVLPLFFWLWDKEKAVKLLFILLPSLLLNFWLKELFHSARPLGVALIEQGGFAFPSGHAQGSTTLWLMLALLIRKKWLNYFAVIMIILVSVSRLYLGVHYPTDIFGGILLGLFLVLIYDKYIYENVKEFLSAKTAIGKVAVLSIVILFFTILYPVADAVTILAVLWGFGIILIYFDVLQSTLPPGIIWKLLILIVGIVGVLLIWKGLKTILPAMLLTRFFRYAVLGAWIAILPFFIKQRKPVAS